MTEDKLFVSSICQEIEEELSGLEEDLETEEGEEEEEKEEEEEDEEEDDDNDDWDKNIE